MNYNKAIIVGRVVADLTVKKTPSGQSVTSFGVATNNAWNDKNGQIQEKTEFHNIVAWAKLAELAASYLVKGSLVLIEGRLETRSWEKDGVTRWMTEIIADTIQFGPRPAAKPPVTVAQPDHRRSRNATAADVDEGTPTMVPLFGDEEAIRPEDIPF